MLITLYDFLDTALEYITTFETVGDDKTIRATTKKISKDGDATVEECLSEDDFTHGQTSPIVEELEGIVYYYSIWSFSISYTFGVIHRNTYTNIRRCDSNIRYYIYIKRYTRQKTHKYEPRK